MKTKLTVGLIDVGGRLPVSLKKLAKKLNSRQKSFLFVVADRVPISKLGLPDIKDWWYDVESLFKILRDQNSAEYQFVVGITHVNFTQPGNDETQEISYFSLSDKKQVSVVCAGQKMLGYNSPLKDAYQYLSYMIVTELLINMTRYDLSHQFQDYCLFDDCVDRSTFRDCIDHGYICTVCENKLRTFAVISEQLIDDVKKVLSWCKRNTTRGVIRDIFTKPITTLIIGAYVGWAAQTVFTKEYFPHMTGFFLLILTFVFIRLRYFPK
jgi:hypothetical protein